ncbi:acyl-CoA N-acyltransferase [Macroventuria anomochaeta]|uniref:Acyl-CoA N-acyltransferase n=1 Tax=Macroventuria anomochaeta TaxID=301207 RepID=A0ACB6RJD4_9PLEO|nr:acyl-CoA N-acyltransferase [Macroventuria anomochaeta]KAF2621933.1 acyl-CoA N-acyltransferase [Macroventuria anomochaeta]
MATKPNPQLIPDPLRPFDTTRLAFRAVRQPEDLALYLAIGNDQDGFMNSNFTNTALPSTADATKFMKSVAEDSLLGATIWLKETQTSKEDEEMRNNGAPWGNLKSEWGTAIGEIHLSRLPPNAIHHRSTEIGIDILPPFQGRGYGREAIKWALDYAFRRAGLHRVRIRAFEWNTGALRLYEKVGFKVEGREREALWHEGRWWDGVELGMLEGEWWALQREQEKKKGNQDEERRTSRAIRIESSQ